jgi:hypothetical protein
LPVVIKAHKARHLSSASPDASSKLLDQVQFQFGTLLRFAAAVFLDEVVTSHVHGLDQRVFVRPDALPEEAVGHGLAGELRDPLQERERLTPRRRPLRLL